MRAGPEFITVRFRATAIQYGLQPFGVMHKSSELRVYEVVNIHMMKGSRTSAAPTATSKIVRENID